MDERQKLAEAMARAVDWAYIDVTRYDPEWVPQLTELASIMLDVFHERVCKAELRCVCGKP